MELKFNTKYLGVLLIALSVILFVIFYNSSQSMLELIDSGQMTCGDTHQTCPHITVLNQAYMGYLVAIIVFIVGLFLVIFGGKPKKPEQKEERWADAMKTLDGDEKVIYEKVMEAGGVMFQSDIVEKTEFPKAKVTRILDKMEARGIVERRRRGMTNAIVLK
jgi:uncharacterized membrane protein